MRYLRNSLLGCLLLTGLYGKSQGVFTIKAQISGDVEGKTVHLLRGDNEKSRETIDSTIIKNGRFEFTGKTEVPQVYMVRIFPTKDRRYFTEDLEVISRPSIPLLISKGAIHIKAALEDIPLSSLYGGYDLSRIQLSGSSVNDAYMAYIQKESAIMELRDKLKKSYREYLNKRPHAPVSQGLEAIGKLDQADSSFKSFVVTFIKDNRNNAAAIYAFRKNYSSNIGLFSPDEIDDILRSFSGELKGTAYYRATLKQANEIKKSAVGSRFLDLSLQDPDGKPVKLSDYVGKGRYVLVDFWGPWCIPCRKEFPFVKETYKLYHPEGFDIIGISVDMDKVRWPKAMNEEQLPWPQFAYLNKEEADKGQQLYNYFGGIPFCVLIAPDGKIVDRNMLGAYMDRRLMEIYGKSL